jgi:hypothetical protein
MSRVLGLLVSVALLLAVMAWKAEGADEKKAQDYTGTLGCAKCTFAKATKADKCAALLKVGDEFYYLKVADGAAEALKAQLADIEKKKLKGDCTVRGILSDPDAAGKKWLTVESLTPKPTDGAKGGGKNPKKH